MTAAQVARLRELRLWHWREAMKQRARERRLESFIVPLPEKVGQARELANFHIKQVQTLNDFFPMGDTAERDLQLFPNGFYWAND